MSPALCPTVVTMVAAIFQAPMLSYRLSFDSNRVVSIGTRSYKHSVGNIVNRLIMAPLRNIIQLYRL